MAANSIQDQNVSDAGSTEDLDILISKAAREPTPVILQLSLRLFRSGRRDEGVFWYYVGQLRARMEEEADSSAAQAYGAVFATFGPEINEFAFGDVDKLTATIDRVLAWDEAHPLENIDPAVRAKQRAGLADLRTYVIAHRDQLRKSRAAKGLPNTPN